MIFRVYVDHQGKAFRYNTSVLAEW